MEATRDVWLGIDLGTQSAKIVAVSQAGQMLACSVYPLTGRREGPRHEQDAREWWSVVARLCAETVTQLRSYRIRGVAVDGTSGTILLVDERGEPLTPAMMYDDCRASDQAQKVNEIAGSLTDPSFSQVQTTWALPKLLWLYEHGGSIAGARLVHQADFINWRLAGQQLPSDWSNALKTGYDVNHESWRYALFDALRIPPQALPVVVRPGTEIGHVSANAAMITGIPAGTPIIAGMTDGCASQIAAGAFDIGDWNSVLGTTLVLKGVTEEAVHDLSGVVYSHRSPDGYWLPGGACNVGAAALSKYFPGRDLDALTVKAACRETSNVMVYPLVGRGERFPFHAPEAEGFLLGTPGDEVDVFLGILRGVAFLERLCFDYLDLLGAPLTGKLTFTGGAVSNRYWCQLRSDVLCRRVCIPENAEAAFGMAILALAGRKRLADTAKRIMCKNQTIEPRPDRAAGLLEHFLFFIEELERRGWLPSRLADHAAKRATQAMPAAETAS